MNYVDNESLWILIPCPFDPTKRNNQMVSVVFIAQPRYPGKHSGTSPLYVQSHFAPSEWPSPDSLGIQRSEFQKTKEIPLVFTLRY